MSKRLLRVVLCVYALVILGWGKDKPLTAIILYTSDSGPAYVHASDILLNGRTEVLACPSEKTIDNNGYRKLSKMLLSQAVSLERRADGILYMATTSGSTCVVPSNLKLERNVSYSPKDMADRAVISGTFVARSSNGMQSVPSEFKAGTILHFVATPDTELAEYLRAARAQSIPLWRTYVGQYPSSPHAAEAKQSLATLITAAAAADLAEYQKSVPTQSPNYAKLRSARLQADDAHSIAPGFVPAGKLQFDIRTQIQSIVTAAHDEMTAYQQSLTDRKPGYEHLLNAQGRITDALSVDAGFDTGLHLQAEIAALVQAIQQAIALAESQVSAKRFDEAYSTISRYRHYSTEVPEIAKVVDAAFKNRHDRGQENLEAGRWNEAIANFQRALTYKDDPETAAALKRAQGELQTVQNKEAADKAIEGSRMLAADKRYVEAYETLAELPAEQRTLVSDAMTDLQPRYQEDLIRRSETLSRLHVPIRGRADEDAVRLAHDYLSRVSRMTDDEAVRVKLDLLSDRLSDYYLKQATRLLSKPRGSGAGLGWLMLEEAQTYKPDLQAIKDSFTKYAPLYETHAKLSIGIRMRDQTSRREGMGFADQMTDTIAAGLEAAHVPGLKIVSLAQIPATGTDSQADASLTQPNFLLQGDILQHRVEKKSDTERMSSHYRSGQSEIHNPAWLEAKRQVDAVQEEIDKAEESLRPAPGRRRKSPAEAEQEMRALTDRQSELKKKLASVPEYVLQDVVLPYNYTKRTVQLTAIIEMSFRLSAPSEEPREVTRVSMNLPKTYVLLENVKPEDVDGILENDTPPDELELLGEAERQAKTAMMAKLVEKLGDLPKGVLDKARGQAASKDAEAAAESYVLYLNATAAKATPERAEAEQFLQKEFNVGQAKSAAQ